MAAIAAGLACLGWVATTCALLWLLNERDKRSQAEHEAHREEVSKLGESHRREIAELNQARIEEVSSLLQRIQAPEHAVVEHATRDAAPDPPPLDYEDDEALIAERRRQLEGLMPGVLAPELLRMAHVPPYEPYEGDGSE